MYTNAAKQLKQNTKVVMNSFQTSGLSVTSFNIKPDSDGACTFYIELQGQSLTRDVEIKVNLYDKEGDIYTMEKTTLYDDFNGYDTISIFFSDEDILNCVSAARIYACPQ